MTDYSTSEMEKRKFMRVKADMVMSFRIFCTLKIDNPEVLNISEEGLMFTSNQSLALGQSIDVMLTIPNSPKPIRLEGKVVWNERTKNKKSFNTGVVLNNISPQVK